MLALAIGLWPDPSSVFDPKKAGAFITALALWLFAELFPQSEASATPIAGLDPHDLELGKKLRAIATDDFIRFLDEHDFGGSYRGSNAMPLNDLADTLRSASSAFNDSELESALGVIKTEAFAFARMLSRGAWLKHGTGDLFTMIPDDEPDGLWSNDTEAKVAAANGKADDLAVALKTLLAMLRRKGLSLIAASDSREAPQIFV
jgi:hypothetical protein